MAINTTNLLSHVYKLCFNRVLIIVATSYLDSFDRYCCSVGSLTGLVHTCPPSFLYASLNINGRPVASMFSGFMTEGVGLNMPSTSAPN